MIKRSMIKVSYMPKDIDTFWNILIGIWFAGVMTHEVLIIRNYGIVWNLINITSLFSVLSVYIIMISIGFIKGFRWGNISAYFLILLLTAGVSFVLFDFFLKGVQIADLSALWSFTLRIKLLALIFGSGLFVILLVAVQQICFTYLKNSKKRVRKNPRFWSLISIVGISYILATILFSSLFYFWDSLVEPKKLFKIFELIRQSDQVLSLFQKRLVSILLLNLIILFRIISMEVFFQIGKRDSTIGPEPKAHDK